MNSLPQTETKTKAQSTLLPTHILEFLSASSAVTGSLMLASHSVFSPHAWWVLVFSTLCGIPWARRMRLKSMLTMQWIFLVVNMLGVWRYSIPILADGV